MKGPTIEYGDDPPEGTWFAVATARGRKVHLVNDLDSPLALCGTGVDIGGPEHRAGYLCVVCTRAVGL